MKISVKLGFHADLELNAPDALSLFDIEKGLKMAEGMIKSAFDAALMTAVKQLTLVKVTAKVLRTGIKIEKVES